MLRLCQQRLSTGTTLTERASRVVLDRERTVFPPVPVQTVELLSHASALQSIDSAINRSP